MNRRPTSRDKHTKTGPPWDARLGDRPTMLFPAAVRRLWLDGWEQGYLDGYQRAQEERRALDDAGRAA